MSTLYTDPLVTITDDGIEVRRYSLLGRAKRAAWADVESVRALAPSLATGKWRLWGTGDFATWFARDFDRPARDTIFHMKLRTQRTRVGFTAHDAERVKEILRARGVLAEERAAAPSETPAAVGASPPSLDGSLSRPSVFRSPALYAILLVAALLILQAIYYHPRLPQSVASHFDARGNVDGFATRATFTTINIGVGAGFAALFVLVSGVFSGTAAAAVGRWLLWSGAATLALILVIMHLAYRANVTSTPSIGLGPWYALIGYAMFMATCAIALVRKLR